MSWQRCAWISGSIVGLLALAVPASGATPEQVEKAIEKAQQYILKEKAGRATWEKVAHPMAGAGQTDLKERQWGGLTAICTYALLGSGMNPQDKQIKPAVDFLLSADIQSTYGLGLSSQIVTFGIPEKETRPLVKRNVQMLLHGMHLPAGRGLGERDGFYGYWVGTPAGTTREKFDPKTTDFGKPQPKDWYDRSNSQYGVLGMWALEEAGGEVPGLYWKIVDAAWRNAQHKDGGWDYRRGDQVTPSMTAAGVATLFITQDYLMDNVNWGVCKGGVRDLNIEQGLHWMDRHINNVLNSGDMYTFYGVERIGTASGRRYFGTRDNGVVDWYQLGADYLVKHQTKDGSWAEFGPVPRLPATCYGLLFLARGRAPVMMNKLEYETTPRGGELAKATDFWNERPRDVANLAHWSGKQLERYLNWQVVTLGAAPEDLHDAPILYISGSQPLEFNAAQLAKLRTFVEQGGMILGNADCGQAAFSRSFRQLGAKLFHKEFARVPANDLIYREQFKGWRSKPVVEEINNGVRKLMLLIPEADPSRAWQTRSDRTRESLFQLGANIFLYAIDKENLLNKGQTYVVKKNFTPAAKTIKLARLEAGENPNPEPGGWARLAAILHNTSKIDLDVKLIKPAAADLNGFRIAHLTGTARITLTAAQRSAIRQFVIGGGTLIVDAAGGSAEFADSAEAELRAMFPQAGNDGGQVLPPDDPLFTQTFFKIKQVGWRRYALDSIVGNKRTPRLRGIKVGNRIGVYYSRYDLSAGLVGEPVDGVVGYDPKTATDLMADIILYATGNFGPATRPATAPHEDAAQPAAGKVGR